MNWPAFFSMNGHGAYVWGALVLSFALLGAEAFGLRQRTRRGVQARAAGGATA